MAPTSFYGLKAGTEGLPKWAIRAAYKQVFGKYRSDGERALSLFRISLG